MTAFFIRGGTPPKTPPDVQPSQSPPAQEPHLPPPPEPPPPTGQGEVPPVGPPVEPAAAKRHARTGEPRVGIARPRLDVVVRVAQATAKSS